MCPQVFHNAMNGVTLVSRNPQEDASVLGSISSTLSCPVFIFTDRLFRTVGPSTTALYCLEIYSVQSTYDIFTFSRFPEVRRMIWKQRDDKFLKRRKKNVNVCFRLQKSKLLNKQLSALTHLRVSNKISRCKAWEVYYPVEKYWEIVIWRKCPLECH